MSKNNWIKRLAASTIALAICAAHATEATVAGDAYLNSATPTVNYGSLSNLYVGNGGTALIQFDLSSLPAGTTATQIGKATVTLYVNRINASGPVSVHSVTSPWSESSVTYATIPTLGTAVASFTPTIAQQFVVIDVTLQMQGWVTNPSSNYGIALTSTAGNIVFDSKENDETSHVAHLDITVISQGPAGATGATGAPGATGAQGLQGIQGIQGLIGPAGSVGPQGNPGVAGPAGPTGAQGPPVSFKNAWSSGTVYVLGDAVAENGASYIALANNLNLAPASNPAIWALLAAKGDTGAQGPQGSQGATGQQGQQGNMGVAGTAATVTVGTTTTVGPGSSAAVNNVGTNSNAVLNFTIPQGATGSIGAATEYASAVPYATGNVVFCSTTCATNGSSYVSLIAGNTGHDPSSSPTYWQLIAKAGATPTVNSTVNVSTLSSGASATASASTTGTTTTLTLGIPQGPQGIQGPKGDVGTAGSTGPQGPPVNFRGPWVSGAQYMDGDAVSSNVNGSS